MGRHTFLGVLLFTLIALGVALFLPGRSTDKVENLPWQIEPITGGSVRVFGIELERTPLGEIELLFGEPAEISLFDRGNGMRVVEAYFDNVDLSGLRARMVLVMALGAEELETIYSQGARIATLGSGTRKVTLNDKDLARVRATPISGITYIPRSNLDAEIIEKRFGAPSRRILEKESGIEHWLYPDKGLDIALNPEGKEVLQYVVPARFDSLVQPLEKPTVTNDM